MILAMIKIIVSYTAVTSSVIGVIKEDTPSINRMLKMFEPTTFPTARSFSPFLAATTDVTSSGSDVPSATMVRPINVWLHPNVNAIFDALSTTRLPPHTIPINPITI